jgi:hypothetical protein
LAPIGGEANKKAIPAQILILRNVERLRINKKWRTGFTSLNQNLHPWAVGDHSTIQTKAQETLILEASSIDASIEMRISLKR